jgi:hypothetical protein
MSKGGTVKIVSGNATTVNVSVDDAISSSTTSAIMKNRVVTNDRPGVGQALKNIYIDGPLFRNISEICHGLRMAEYLHSIVGTTIKNFCLACGNNDPINQTNNTLWILMKRVSRNRVRLRFWRGYGDLDSRRHRCQHTRENYEAWRASFLLYFVSSIAAPYGQ